MKKLAYTLFAGALLLRATAMLADTGVVVYEKDGTTTFFPSENLEYVEFVDDYSSIPDTPDSDIQLSDAIKNLSVGMKLNATAVVVAQDVRGVVIQDKAGGILYYNDKVDLSKYPIGSVVNVSGEVSTYNRGYQLTNTATLEVIGEMAVTYPQPTVYTATMMDNACNGTDNIAATYVSLEGQLSISGNYYNIIVPGALSQGSLYYVTNDIKDQLQTGNNYKFEGYYIAVSGSTQKYFNIVVTKVNKIDNSTPGTSGGEIEIPSEYTFPLSYVVLPEGTPQQVKDYTGFTVNFNKNNHTPNYVAWELTSSEANSTNVATSRNYWVDNDIEGCLSTDYAYNTYKFDRGHMCPAADQRWSQEAMKACAVMTNMVPQASSFNGGMWSTLEGKERTNANKYGKIWIISGPVYYDTDQTYIGDAKARVPSACFKAFLYENGANSKAIAYVMNNGANAGNYKDYAMSIDDLEEILGYDLFPALPDEIENVVEASFNASDWD